MKWQGKRVLVTGAGGFIGSHLTEKLVELGADTVALVHYGSNGSWGWLDGSENKDDIEVFTGDVRDRDSLTGAMAGADIVFHLAALIAIPYSYQAPLSYIQTNIEGTLNVLQSARDAKVDLVVQTSSSEVYGSAQYVPIDEEHPLQGQSPYSASKIGADKLAESFYLSYGLPVATIRPFNTYGPRQSARAVIPTIISQALTGSSVLLGNLEPTRDFNFVADTVDGFIKIGSHPNAVGQVINIGTGQEISIGALCNTILTELGKPDLPVVSEDVRIRPENSEVDRLCASNIKAREVLDWQPKHTLQEGISKTIEWIRNDPEIHRPKTYAI
jgi:NAD dependent epimerase/dehydratase